MTPSELQSFDYLLRTACESIDKAADIARGSHLDREWNRHAASILDSIAERVHNIHLNSQMREGAV